MVNVVSMSKKDQFTINVLKGSIQYQCHKRINSVSMSKQNQFSINVLKKDQFTSLLMS